MVDNKRKRRKQVQEKRKKGEDAPPFEFKFDLRLLHMVDAMNNAKPINIIQFRLIHARLNHGLHRQNT